MSLLAGMIDTLIDHKEDLSEAIADVLLPGCKGETRVRQDLVAKSSEDSWKLCRLYGLANCDVTYPPQGRVEAA